jgi:hypothetical protein
MAFKRTVAVWNAIIRVRRRWITITRQRIKMATVAAVKRNIHGFGNEESSILIRSMINPGVGPLGPMKWYVFVAQSTIVVFCPVCAALYWPLPYDGF